MSYKATVYRIMIATPGDITQERDAIRKVIHEWNDVFSKSSATVLMPVAWDTNAAPDMSDRAQGVINKTVLCDCDLLVAVFKDRLGSDTGKAPSGTVEEIREQMNAGKPTMIYFSNAPVDRKHLDSKQLEDLDIFKTTCSNKGLIGEFDDKDDFYNKFKQQLPIAMFNYFKLNISDSTKVVSAPEKDPELSSDAKKILRTAADDNGMIMRIRDRSGGSILAGHTDLCADKSPRELARWESALNELLKREFIQRVGYNESYEVTDLGYKEADSLNDAEGKSS